MSDRPRSDLGGLSRLSDRLRLNLGGLSRLSKRVSTEGRSPLARADRGRGLPFEPLALVDRVAAYPSSLSREVERSAKVAMVASAAASRAPRPAASCNAFLLPQRDGERGGAWHLRCTSCRA